jgi:hypothetical protein
MNCSENQEKERFLLEKRAEQVLPGSKEGRG